MRNPGQSWFIEAHRNVALTPLAPLRVLSISDCIKLSLKEPQKGSDMIRTASCHCGQLSLGVEGEPALVSACSCTRCQKRSGSAFALTSRWSKNQVKSCSGDSTTYTRKGASGGNVECTFCPVCGSTVRTALELLPDLVGIPVGRFADPTFPEPKVAAWCESKLEWVRFPQGVLLLHDQTRPIETR